MFKMSTCGGALLLAGVVGLACSNHSGLHLGGGSHEWRTRGSRHGGQYERRTSKRPERLRESRWHLRGTKLRRLLWLMEPQQRRVFLRIEHDVLLSAAQLFALRNRRWDVHSGAAGLVP